jgi:hypothetical protein
VSPAAGRPADRGPEMRVGRLALRVTGLDEGEARTLGHLVAEGLASGLPAAAGGGLGLVRIQLTADAAEQGRPERLARRIVEEFGRILTRGQAPGWPGEEGGR